MNKERLLSLTTEDIVHYLLGYYKLQFELSYSTKEETDTIYFEGSREDILKQIDKFQICKLLELNNSAEFEDQYMPYLEDSDIRVYIKNKTDDYDPDCLKSLLREMEYQKFNIDDDVDSYVQYRYAQEGWECPKLQPTEKKLRMHKSLSGNESYCSLDYHAMREKVLPCYNFLYCQTLSFIKVKIEEKCGKDEIRHYANCLDIPIGVLFYIWDPRRPALNKMMATLCNDISKRLWDTVYAKHPEIAPLRHFDIQICIPPEQDIDDKYESNTLDFLSQIEPQMQRVFSIREQELKLKDSDQKFYFPAFYFRCAHPQQIKLAVNDPSYKKEIGYTARICLDDDYCIVRDVLPQKDKLIKDLADSISYHIGKYSQISNKELLECSKYGIMSNVEALGKMWYGEVLLRNTTKYNYEDLTEGELAIENIHRFSDNFMRMYDTFLIKSKYYVLGSVLLTRDVYEPLYEHRKIDILNGKYKSVGTNEFYISCYELWKSLVSYDRLELGGKLLENKKNYPICKKKAELYKLFTRATIESNGVYETYLANNQSNFTNGLLNAIEVDDIIKEHEEKITVQSLFEKRTKEAIAKYPNNPKEILKPYKSALDCYAMDKIYNYKQFNEKFNIELSSTAFSRWISGKDNKYKYKPQENSALISEFEELRNPR